MQVSPRRLLPREAVPGRGKVRGTRWDGAVISVIGGGGACAVWGAWEMGSGRAQPQPLPLQSPTPRAGQHPGPAARSSAPISRSRRPPGLRGGVRLLPGCSEASPTRAPARPARALRGSPCLSQRRKKNSRTTLKSTFAQPASCPAAFTLLCWNLLCKGNLFPAGAERGDVGWRQWGGKIQNKARRASACVCGHGGGCPPHLLPRPPRRAPGPMAGEPGFVPEIAGVLLNGK